MTDEIVYLDAAEEAQYTIAQASEPVDDKTGQVPARPGALPLRARARPSWPTPKDVEYMDVAPAQIVSVATALIPFLEHNDANRALMGANMQRQAVPLMITEAPLVGTGLEYRAAVDTGDVVLAEKRRHGRSTSTPSRSSSRRKDGSDEYDADEVHALEPGHADPPEADRRRSATRCKAGAGARGRLLDRRRRARARHEPARRLHAVRGLQLRGRDRASPSGSSRTTCSRSIHIHEYEIDARSTKLGDEEITRDIPNRSEESLKDLDERGIVRIGAEVGSGDLLVGKVTPKGETELTAEEKLIRAIFKEKAREVRDTSLKVPHGEGGKVIDVKTFSREAGDDLSPGVNELVRVYVAKKRKIAEGDKLAGRHGNKGVISKIVPEEDMPFLEDGTPVDVVLNPLGVPSRMNIGQILETHLGWAAAHGVFARERRRSADGAPTPVATPVFDGATPRGRRRGARRVDEAEPGLADQDERRPEAAAPAGAAPGKVRLFNGKTGEPFEQKVTVGYMYILKLLHLVDDKIHARSTGPYSLVTQQPLGGKAQFGGQRFGEMEVWALEAYGAAYTLQEMLTIKSDDTVGRVKAYEAIVKGENIAEPSIPESFKVLLKEMQSLALDVHVLSEEGAEVEVREEDDELLRAAEELGIDLSPGLAPRGRARADRRGGRGGRRSASTRTASCRCPADEALGDLDDVELAGEEAADGGAAEVGPRRRRGRARRVTTVTTTRLRREERELT